jgi:DNA polymerase-1
VELYLIDGHALAYRAYFAFIRNPLVSSAGEETSAVFGFTNTIFSILKRHAPSHIAVVFDSSEKTFRHDLYESYKAHREKMPDSLVQQIKRIHSLLEAMSIPVFSIPGYEADDVLATIASKLEKKIPIRIVSGDKDLFQLVNERTHVIRPGKGSTIDDEVDAQRLQKKMGLTAAELVDYFALMGDASDNVPGVSGVGEKTALKLIREYGSLENVYQNVDKIPSKSLRKKLIADRDKAFLSRDLIRLDRSVPVDFSLAEMERGGFQTDRLYGLLTELELNRLLEAAKQFEAISASDEDGSRAVGEDHGGTTVADKQYRLVDDETKLRELTDVLNEAEEFALDVETSDIQPMRAVLAGISIATELGLAWYVPVRSRIEDDTPSLAPPPEAPGLPLDTVRGHLGPVFCDPSKKKIGQNIKYDSIVLHQAGFELDGIDFDTMIASYCLHPARRSHGLDSLSKEMFDYDKIPFQSLFDKRTKKKDIRLVPLSRVKDYACEDADFTLRLKREFEPLVRASQVERLFRDVEMPLSIVLTEMEIQGIRLDRSVFQDLSERIARDLSRLERSIYQTAGETFNINSTAHLQVILFEKLGLKPHHKTKTGYSTDVEVLKALSSEHELPKLVLEYRSLDKLKNTYVDAIPKLIHPRTGRIHTSYNQAVTTTGRLSSSDPNLQNIPIRTELGREIRRGFVSGGPGWILLDADYSQVELRILAHLSEDAELCRAFEEDKDVHRMTAAKILGVSPEDVSDDMRSRAKMVNFGVVYGMGARGLAQALDIEFKEAKQFIEDYFNNYPGVKRFIDDTIESARVDGAVATLLGRVRHLPGINSSNNRTRSFAERTAVNTPVQGTAADIIKTAMVELHKTFEDRGLQAKMILQVHDELLFDLPEAEAGEVRAIVRDTMENAIQLKVPLKVDMGMGENWLEAHP